ncbi:secretory protein [Bordetella pertussis]|nr:secretory protein [Bordetella pertussis]
MRSPAWKAAASRPRSCFATMRGTASSRAMRPSWPDGAWARGPFTGQPEPAP